MTDTPAAYLADQTPTALRCRTALIEHIRSQMSDRALADLPDVCLIIISRALDRDLVGVRQFAKPSPFSPTLCQRTVP